MDNNVAESILNRITETYSGVLVRNLSKTKATEFLIEVLAGEELQAITEKSATLISKVKNGKRSFSEDDINKIFSWYQKVSLVPLYEESISDDYHSSDSDPLFTKEEVRKLEKEFTLAVLDIDKTMTKFKQSVRQELRYIKKELPE